MVQAYKAVGESTEIPLTYYENNVSATIKLLQVMNEFDCTRIVYSSSATVYGTPPHIPIPESTRIQAESPYGKTKVMCETIMEDLCSGEPCHPALGALDTRQVLILMRAHAQLSPHDGARYRYDTSSTWRPLI